MASLIYASLREDMARGNVDFDTDSFKLMLVDASYVPNKTTHDRRDDITNEVSGTGYTAGGSTITVSITGGGASPLLITFNEVSFVNVTISPTAGVIYKSRGGAASADELVLYNDFGLANMVGTTLIVSPVSISVPVP